MCKSNNRPKALSGTMMIATHELVERGMEECGGDDVRSLCPSTYMGQKVCTLAGVPYVCVCIMCRWCTRVHV
jgi:hypothetical protein